MVLHVIDSGALSPEKIMQKDAQLLDNLQRTSPPILHFYQWEGKCLTYGYFTQPADFLDLNRAQDLDIKLARRPTGGGIIFHLTDFAFSILIPVGHPGYSLNSLTNYAFINQLTIQALANVTQNSLHAELWSPQIGAVECRPDFCMAKPTPYDLVVQGKKIGGAAQRKKKWGYLHQGSISLCPPPFPLLKMLVKDLTLFSSIQSSSEYLVNYTNTQDIQELQEKIKISMIEVCKQYL